MITFKKPAIGLNKEQTKKYIGKKITNSIKEGELIEDYHFN